MQINESQKYIIWLAIALIALMGLFPPWSYTFDSPGRSGGSMHSEKPAGYGFIFLPPLPESKGSLYGIRIDFGRMFLQWFLVVAICTAIIMYLHIKKNSGIIELKDIVSEEETPDHGKEWARKYIKDVMVKARKEKT